MAGRDEENKAGEDRPGGVPDPAAESQPVEFSRSVQPVLRKLCDYLGELVEHLNRAEAAGRIDFEVRNCTGLKGLEPRNFQLSVDETEMLNGCTLRYACVGEQETAFVMPTKDAAERQQQYLWQHKLRISTKKTSDERWEFRLEPNVPVLFEFTVDGERRVIRLRVSNHERLGTDSYSYDPEDINALYLDELAKYVMRKPNRFHALSGDVMPEDTLKELRQKLAESKVEHASELDRGPSGSGGAPKEAKKGLFSRLFKR